jgi:hypothetical protein
LNFKNLDVIMCPCLRYRGCFSLFICGEPEGEPAWIPELDKFKQVLAFIWDPTLTDLNFPHKRNDLGWLS